MKNYFDGKISHGFVSLYTGKTIVMIATGLLGLFLPIFIFNLLGQNFQYTILYFVAGYSLYIISLFFGVRFLNKFGFRKALRLSVILGALYWVLFYLVDENNVKVVIPLILMTLAFYRLAYWVPYHVDFAKFTSKRNRGRQISALRVTRETIGVFIPLVGGFVISRFGFDALFVTAIILYLTSGIPYLTLPRTKEKFLWSYIETLKNFFAKKYRKEMVAFMADGAETSSVILIWPIFIFQLLNGDYLQIGLLSTLIIGVTVVFQLIMGKKIDKSARKEKILKYGSIFSSISWLIKIFIETALQIFVISAFHNLMKIFTRTPFDTLTYEISADRGHYVDEFTVLREMAINFGRVVSLMIAFFASFFLPIQYLFLLAAVSSMGLNFLRKPIVQNK
ncbi:MAG: MFS transporter [Candidatus Marinimicrobia bacterium]|nr:MFS transporter [Candidatus Neomarinimicrobiota bacterium]